jgi:PQQ-dependent catabolism-associated CXXCW motif protein
VIDPAQAMALHAQGVPFLDTLPRQKRPEGLPPGTIWNAEAHHTIPGAVWLYDTGYDRISGGRGNPAERRACPRHNGDKAAPVVIFCKADCWMSWNAAKRAVALGYTGVNWYPEGVDGWVMAGGDLVVADAP